MHHVEPRRVATNGIEIAVRVMGRGPAILLLHGWPHTGVLWNEIMPLLAEAGFTAVAPDLRGLGDSTKAEAGYDVVTQAEDMKGLLSALEIGEATAVGFDVGAGVATMLALRERGLIGKLALCEALVGNLSGAEGFLAHGAPWWFGFHAVKGLAETVVEGSEPAYLDWFYKDVPAMDPEVRAAFISAYTGREALRCGFEHYRCGPQDAGQINLALRDDGKIDQPTLAIVGGFVGDAFYRQLIPVAPDLRRVDIPNCHHIVPLEQPRAFAEALIGFSS